MIGSFALVEMSEHHLDDVIGIESRCNSNPWSGTTFLSEMRSATHIIFVAILQKDNGQERETVLGFAGGQLVSDELHIHSLAVDEIYRRNSIGRSLIIKLLDYAKRQGVKSSTLEVRVSNFKAIELYEKLGFLSEGIRPKYYADNGEDAAIMWLRDL